MKQAGFAHIIAIVAVVAVVAGVGTVTYMSLTKSKQNDTQQSKTDTSTDKTNDKENVTKPVAEQTTPVPEPTPTPETTPEPASKPVPQPLAAADCVGSITAYVIAQGGAPISYKSPSAWSTVKTLPYGQQVTVYCKTGSTGSSPEYGLVDDAYIRMNQLSRTAP